MPWIVAPQAPLFTEFSGQEYWNGLQFPAPGDVPNPGTGPVSPALADGLFTTEPLEKPQILKIKEKKKEFAVFIFYFFLNWQH